MLTWVRRPKHWAGVSGEHRAVYIYTREAKTDAHFFIEGKKQT